MNRPTNLEIRIDQKFPRLDHAPIVEAVIQLNAPPTKVIDQPELMNLLKHRFDGYSITDQLQLEAGFTGSPAGVEMHHKSLWDGFRVTSSDGKKICQWKRNCLIFSQMAPYTNWEDFQSAVLPFWDGYRAIHSPEIIESIGVRFISQILLRQNQKISEFVGNARPPLKGLGLRSNSFFHQDTIPVKGYPYEIRLVRVMQRTLESPDSKQTLIVDIDVSRTESIEFIDLDRTLQEIRFLKNTVFFAYMKDAENKFK